MYRRRSELRSVMEQYGLIPDRGVISLLVVLSLVYLVFRIGGEAVAGVFEHLILTPARAIGPEPWQLVTSMFVTPKFTGILSAAVTLLFFGNQVERIVGARGFWKIFVVGGFGGALAAALVGRVLLPEYPLFGAAAAGAAMLTAFAALLDGRRMQLFGAAMRSGTIAWIWLGINALLIVGELVDHAPWQAVVVALAELAGGAAAGWFLGGGRGNIAGNSIDRLRMWRLRRRYRVLPGGRDGKRYLN